MSFSNSKQHNHPKNTNPSDRAPKTQGNNHPDYPEDQGSYVRKSQKNQGETSYHRKSTQDDLESSQNYHKSSRVKQNRGNYDDMRNYEEGHQNGNKRKNYKQGGSRGNQEQGQYYAKKGESQHEGGYNYEKEAENLNLKQNGGRKPNKERKDKNKEKYEDSYDTVYYVKRSQHGSQQGKSEEQKRENNTKVENSQNRADNTPKAEVSENKADKESILKQLEAQAISIMSQLQPNKKVSNGVPKGTDSGVKTASQLLNKPDSVSLTASKPIIEVPAPSDTQSVTGNNQSVQDDKDTISVISDTDTTHSKQAASIPQYPQPQILSPAVSHPQTPASAEQQRVAYTPAFQQIPQLPVFHAPYIVFPQPNGTSIIQPLYQMPGMNMMPRRSEEEARFAQQPMYLVPSTLIPTPENQQSTENRQRTQAMPAHFFGGFPINPQFMPYAQMNPGFMTMPSPIVTQPMHSNAHEKELQRSSTVDSQREDNASDRRDD